jgi:hypothetical protein
MRKLESYRGAQWPLKRQLRSLNIAGTLSSE